MAGRGCLSGQHHFSTAQICLSSRFNNSEKATDSNPTPGTRLPRERDHYPSPPQPTGVPHTSHLSKREYSRLWRWVQVRPGMRREEQPRQRVRFTEGSLGAEAGGGLDARSPSLVFPPSRSLPGSITPLTAVIQAASLWSSPCGSKISLAPGSLDPERGRSGRPGGVSRHWGLSSLGSPPCVRRGLTWYKKLSLWKASRSFTGPAIRAARALHTRPSTGPAPRIPTPPASAQGKRTFRNNPEGKRRVSEGNRGQGSWGLSSVGKNHGSVSWRAEGWVSAGTELWRQQSTGPLVNPRITEFQRPRGRAC